MSAACDLEWDFNVRFPDGDILDFSKEPFEAEQHHKILPYALFCEAADEAAVRLNIQETKKTAALERINKNQSERYHHLAAAPVGGDGADPLPDLYLDFKKVVPVPLANLYEGVRQHDVARLAVIPPIHLHSLIQRFYAFLSRIGIPD